MKKKAALIITAAMLLSAFCGCGNDNKPAETGTEGSAVNTESISEAPVTDPFYIEEISDEIFDRIYGKSFKEDCTLPREDLRYLHILHKDLDGNEHEGEMIVNKHIAEDVLDILKQLYDADYPIEKIRLVDEYDADDEASMEDNNSSSFNFRFISHTTRVSKHGLGLAVDINTLYNPYTKIVDGERIIEPINGEPYLDRAADFPYKIDENDLCYKLFIEHGFEWGGAWEDRKDYQHFEIPTEKIKEWYPENYAEQTSAIPEETSASVSLGLTSVGNARELGGYLSSDGRAVRHGVLLRTASLAGATEEDLSILKEKYHLAVIADFRMDAEAERAPDPDIDGVLNLKLPIMDTELLSERRVRMSELLAESEDPTDRMTQLLAAVDAGIVSDQMYVEFLMGAQGKEGYRQFFEELLALPEGESMLFHCSQGKDRTGVAAMLILSALGVDEETMLEDYMLTNEFNAESITGERQLLAEHGIPEEKIDTYLMAMDQVNSETMTNALDWLKENYGSVNGYLEQELGVGETQRTALRDKFLQ